MTGNKRCHLLLALLFVSNIFGLLPFGSFNFPSDDLSLLSLHLFLLILLLLFVPLPRGLGFLPGLRQDEAVQLGVTLPDTQRPVLAHRVQLTTQGKNE